MKNKFNRLTKILKKYKRVLIAYSGGVDSTFLVAVARKILGKENVMAVTAVSETYPKNEFKKARCFLKSIHVKHLIITTEELKNKKFVENSKDRCFHCKKELFKKLLPKAKKYDMLICDGSNYSDRSDFRPGRKAVIEFKVMSPLEEAGLTKSEIRILSKKMKLPAWNSPAQACLASRIPYDTAITSDILKKIEAGEHFLKKFIQGNLRIRYHKDIARIEADEKEMKKLMFNKKVITNHLKKLGWKYIAMDLNGYRTGSLNN